MGGAGWNMEFAGANDDKFRGLGLAVFGEIFDPVLVEIDEELLTFERNFTPDSQEVRFVGGQAVLGTEAEGIGLGLEFDSATDDGVGDLLKSEKSAGEVPFPVAEEEGCASSFEKLSDGSGVGGGFIVKAGQENDAFAGEAPGSKDRGAVEIGHEDGEGFVGALEEILFKFGGADRLAEELFGVIVTELSGGIKNAIEVGESAVVAGADGEAVEGHTGGVGGAAGREPIASPVVKGIGATGGQDMNFMADLAEGTGQPMGVNLGTPITITKPRNDQI